MLLCLPLIENSGYHWALLFAGVNGLSGSMNCIALCWLCYARILLQEYRHLRKVRIQKCNGRKKGFLHILPRDKLRTLSHIVSTISVASNLAIHLHNKWPVSIWWRMWVPDCNFRARAQILGIQATGQWEPTTGTVQLLWSIMLETYHTASNRFLCDKIQCWVL